MADLQYSLDLLGGLGRDLDGMARSLDGVAARTNWTEQGIGHSRVANALEDFAGSWDDKRERLTTSLRAVGEMATASAQTFQEIDDELAGQIQEAVEGVQ